MTTEEKLNQAYKNFWIWFLKNERRFFKIVKSKKYIEQGFLDPILEELEKIKDGFYILTGMKSEEVVDLIFTADADLSNIVFIEELVRAAPNLENWNFEASKPASDIEQIQIQIEETIFNSDTLKFYPTQHQDYPDEIEITIVYQEFEETDKGKITNGIYLFLENYLGELHFASTIDVLNIESKKETANQELIPIEKLKSYLIWREKEYQEKYGEIVEIIKNNDQQKSYSLLKGELPNGKALLAIINKTLLHWNNKSSCPYITALNINYEKINGFLSNGFPKSEIADRLEELEDNILNKLKNSKAYLSIGRETANNHRKIYFASTDFRFISKVMFDIQQKYIDVFEIDYEIYKDKYWQSFERFMVE
ncbi:DUF695 domain-containing protein [Bernardetia sp. ABR2-2B]|uniref:DUF695 domain-containing protein n=1 Tax=Bernardetia sp. ABR2-2B TaxID=3127472 RepID=UPI0030CE19E3